MKELEKFVRWLVEYHTNRPAIDGASFAMEAAAKPAPKPLSMLTTVTPEAQHTSMALSAVRPSSQAP